MPGELHFGVVQTGLRYVRKEKPLDVLRLTRGGRPSFQLSDGHLSERATFAVSGGPPGRW